MRDETPYFDEVKDSQGNMVRVMRVVPNNVSRDMYGHPILDDSQFVLVDNTGNKIDLALPSRASVVRAIEPEIRYSQRKPSPFADAEENPFVEYVYT